MVNQMIVAIASAFLVAVTAADVAYREEIVGNGRKFGMPAPAIVYSVTVRNRLPEVVVTTVTYKKVVTGETLEEQYSLQPGSSYFFDRKTYEEGTARYSYVVESVRAQRGVGEDAEIVSVTSPFKVHSPTRNYVVVIEKDAETGLMSIAHAPHIADEAAEV